MPPYAAITGYYVRHSSLSDGSADLLDENTHLWIAP